MAESYFEIIFFVLESLYQLTFFPLVSCCNFSLISPFSKYSIVGNLFERNLLCQIVALCNKSVLESAIKAWFLLHFWADH